MKKALMVFGTRPEAIKMAPVYLEMRKSSKLLPLVAITGQHREMTRSTLEFFNIDVSFDLDVMEPNQKLSDTTGKIICKLDRLISEIRPQIVLVHGDTTTTMSASIASFYNKIDVAHVEAGLRTGDIYSPWPEEVNRKITGSIARLHFAPTLRAKQNLINESIESQNIFVTGNTVIDALFQATKRIDSDPFETLKLDEKLGIDVKKRLILVTGHRRENFGDGFINICDALVKIAKRQDIQIIYPVHMNPNVHETVTQRLSGINNIRLMPPQTYVDFIHLMRRSFLILTDSGGVQEEAPSLGKPVLVMRDTTERPEAVEAGTVKLVGTNAEVIFEEASKLLDDESAYREISQTANPYGDGQAAKKIRSIIEDFIGH